MQATGSFDRDSPPVISTGIQGRSVVVFDYLPQESKERFYNYNDQVREYERKELETEGIERMKL